MKIAVANQKGGTAKTTTTVSLGAALVRMGRKVLLVDTDPQGDLTKSLGWRDPDSLKVTIAEHIEALLDDNEMEPTEGILHHSEGLDLMPSCIRLASIETALLMAIDRETVIKDWVEAIEPDYDFILFDCMPTLGIVPINVFVAANRVLIPVSTEYLPAVGMTGLLKSVKRIQRRLNPNLAIEGVVFTLFDARTKLAKEVEKIVRRDYGKYLHVFDVKIPRAVSAAESSATGESVLSYDSAGKAALAYMMLAEEVLSNGAA